MAGWPGRRCSRNFSDSGVTSSTSALRMGSTPPSRNGPRHPSQSTRAGADSPATSAPGGVVAEHEGDQCRAACARHVVCGQCDGIGHADAETHAGEEPEYRHLRDVLCGGAGQRADAHREQRDHQHRAAADPVAQRRDEGRAQPHAEQRGGEGGAELGRERDHAFDSAGTVSAITCRSKPSKTTDSAQAKMTKTWVPDSGRESIRSWISTRCRRVRHASPLRWGHYRTAGARVFPRDARGLASRRGPSEAFAGPMTRKFHGAARAAVR